VLSIGTNHNLESSKIGLLLCQVGDVLYIATSHRALPVPDGLHGVPMVLPDAQPDDRSASSIVPNEVHGGYAAVRGLIEHNHRRIAFATAPMTSRRHTVTSPAIAAR